MRKGVNIYYFCDGDLVIFLGIEGMVEFNDCDFWFIYVWEDGFLEIGDIIIFFWYLCGGVIIEVKRFKIVRYKFLDIVLF